ncbi:OmpA family protein [Flavobacterium sp. UMI-01]|uniref:OmpA family protein n=1 Tax=Flavobacterium sp. UMI-01 TaxID=1441053 RepID=UPI001C7D19F5|nr:OmpA family protein [Flavobacterium sp. UMI-01]GIZ09813.1 cell envelope biogenesis protein OmpA [Flavobacterium sp. UMI-01]
MLNDRFFIAFLLVSNLAWAQEQFSVYFDSNKFELSKNETIALTNWIDENKTSKIIGAYGFCDEDGSVEYNEVLASKRVDYVYGIIKDKVKIREDFKSRTFGELHQQLPEKAKNRKVTLFFLKEKDIPKENEILGIKREEPVVVKPKEPIVFPERVAIQNPNGTKTELPLDVAFMQKVSQAKVGEKLEIKNLNFVLNTFAIVNESRGKLYELLLIMQKNPNLKISIQGHICCVGVDSRDLSTQRAKAIYKFLEFNEIDKSRMTYKGFGVSQPLFPVPEKNEAERAANRRVEIEILEN